MNRKTKSGSTHLGIKESGSAMESNSSLLLKAINIEEIFQNFASAIYLTDLDGYITFYNGCAKQLWGITPEIGKARWTGAFKILNTDGSPYQINDSSAAASIKNKKAVAEEFILVRPDNSERTISNHSTPLLDKEGNLIGSLNLMLDITEKKIIESVSIKSEVQFRELAILLEKNVEEKTFDLLQTNEKLRKSEERYHKMIEEVEDYAIILLDKNGIIRNWNRGAEKIKGYSEKEILGKSFELFYLEEDRKKGLPIKLIEQARKEGKAIHEGWRRRKDGTAFWGSIVLTALHNDQNEVIGFSKVTRDLTERKLAEDKLKDYTYELEFQNKELEQFAYAASHDMMEPLRKIHFYTNYIYENASANLDEKTKEYLNRSMNAVKRMSSLIDDLLTYSRTTLQVENFEEVDLNEIVEELVLNNKEDFEQKNIKVKADPLPIIHSVPFQIKQLMDNLFNNSIKYKHPDRDLVIEVKSENVLGYQIREKEVDPEAKYHKVSVIDNGIGFEPVYSEKIFEVFQRLNSSPGTKGSGIGLAICKKIVQNQRGFIKATGKPNEGARFDIYFPVAVPSVWQ